MMKDFNDDEIERILDLGLKDYPGGPSYSFAANTMRQVKTRTYRKNDRRFYLFALLILVLGMGAACGLMLLINDNIGQLFLKTLWKYKLLFGIAAAVLLVSFYADRKYTQPKT